MSTKVSGPDEILANARQLGTPEERSAYLNRACGADASLRQQVEARLAAPAEAHGPAATSRRRPGGRSVVATVLVLAAAGVCVALVVRAQQAEAAAQEAAQQALQERDQARQAQARADRRCALVDAARQQAAEERDEALAAAASARCRADDTQAVLAFLQDNLLAAGRPKVWAGPFNSKVTLRHAADAAAARAAVTLADRPLVQASVRAVLGATYQDLGDPARAVKEYQKALALREARLGPDAPETASCRTQLAVALRIAGRTAEAGQLFAENGDTANNADALAIQGGLLLAQHRPDAAESKLRECLALRERLQPDAWTTSEARSLLGEALLDQKKYAQAEPLLLAGYRGMQKHEAGAPPQSRPRVVRALECLVRLYQAWDRPADAARWQKQLKGLTSAK